MNNDIELYDGTVRLNVNHDRKQHLYLVSKLLPNNVWTEPVAKEGVSGYLKVIPKYLEQWTANVASQTWLGALKSGLEKNKWQETYDTARFAYKEVSNAGKNKGTDFHDAMEMFLKDEDVEPDENIQELFHIFANWWEASEWEALEVELPVYSLREDYCGKADLLARTPAGKTVLCDLKSTKSGVYLENFYQLGGYALAIMEENPEIEIDDLAILNPNVVNADGLKPVVASHFGMSVTDAIRGFSLCKLLTDDLNKNQLRFKSLTQ
jgi:hypothetical protein